MNNQLLTDTVAYRMICNILLVVLTLVAAVNSQSYLRFEFRGDILVNNSYILRGLERGIGEGHNDSLHCVTDNSDCCSNGEGNWYTETGEEVHQGPDGNSYLYVTRGDGVVYLNRRRGGTSGMWRCDIPDSNGVQQSIYIYLGTPTTGVWLCLWCFLSYSALKCPQVDCYQQSSPSLWSLRLMRILLSSLSHVRVQEDQSQRWSGGGME